MGKRHLIEEELKSVQFLGRIVFTKEQLDDLKFDCKSILERGKATFTIGEASLIIMTFVNLVKRWNGDESNFWDYIKKQLELDEFKPSDVYDVIYHYLRNQGRLLYRSEHKNSYYSTLLAQALSPKETMFELFNLLYKVFQESLLGDYEKNDEAFRVISQNLKDKISGDKNDESKIELVDSSVYRLRSSVKYIIEHDLERFILLVDDIMSFFDNPQSISIDDYLGVLLNEWIRKANETLEVKKERTRNRFTTLKLWTPKYILENDKLYIKIPMIRLHDYSNAKKYEYGIKLGGKYTRGSLIVGGTVLFKYIKEFLLEVDISDLQENEIIDCQLEFYADERLIFDSQDFLKRTAIFFSNQLEVKTDSLTNGKYTIITPFIDNLEEIDSHYLSRMRYEVIVDDEFGLKINDDYYFSVQKDAERSANIIVKIFGIKDSDLYFVPAKSDSQINIYRKIDSLIINKKNTQLEAIRVSITLIDSEEIINLMHTFGDEVNYEIDLNDYLNDYQGQIKFVVSDVLSGQRYSLTNVYLDNSIRIENSGRWIYEGNLFQKFNGLQYYFNPENNVISIPYEKGILIVTPNYLKWSFEDCNEMIKSNKIYFWHKDLKANSVLKISSNNDCDAELIVNNESKRISLNTEINLSSILDSYRIDNEDELIKVDVRIDQYSYHLFTIAYQERFTNNPFFEKIDNALIYDISKDYIGSRNSKFILRLENSYSYYEYEIDLVGEISDFCVKDDYYDVTISKINDDVFSLESEVLFNEKLLIGDDSLYRFIDKKIDLKKCKLKKDKRQKYKLKEHFIENIEYIGNDGFPYYHAIMKNGKRSDSVWFEVYNKASLLVKKRHPYHNETKYLHYDKEANALTTKYNDEQSIFEIEYIYYRLGD